MLWRGAVGVLGLAAFGVVATPAYGESVRQWHLDTMHAEEIWQISKGQGVTVAVIDSGVDDKNPDLLGQVLDGKNLAPEEKGDEHTDYDGHGTGMAGLIAGTGQSGGGDGAFGLAPGVKILPIRVPGLSAGSQSQADSDAEFNRVVPEAIRYAVGFPGATLGVVGVGAIDKKLTRTKESQYGPQVDIVAPGEQMVHACGGGTGLCKSHGTSDATALASASAALIWAKHPDWTNNQVLKVMLNTIAAPNDGAGRNDYIGYGAVRPLRALKTPGDPGPAGVRPIPDLLSEQSGSASASPSAAPSSSAPATAPPAASASSDDGGNTGLWVALGVGAAVLVGGGVTVAVVRARRRRTPPVAPPPAYAPYQGTYPTSYHHQQQPPQS
ncbi:S8 family serine peptidase [Streptomyces sp. SKN60]|uniref:S8 family serine peptidase n=1 Tax=Streptomyces sp. SKN60 TaxID=2855506 RepID=UPI002247B27E|nr:S8 family serine peptidase [Streptomyces sp. SKN60]